MTRPHPTPHALTRRQFLGTSAVALGAFHLIPSGVLAAAGRPGANGKFTVAHIGVGGMGMSHVQNMLTFRKAGKVNIAAVCDADENRMEAAATAVGEGVKSYRDYRHIIERKDIDAVLIATPDHWHAVQTVHACQTGKHVYVEKPASVTVREGQAMVAAARAANVAVQVARRRARPKAVGTPAAPSATASWAGCARSPAGTTPIRPTTTRCPTARRPRDWIGICGWGRSRGVRSTGAITRRTSAGCSSRAAARSATGARTSSAPSSGA